MLRLFLALLLAIGGSGMTDEILSRLSKLETDNAALRGQVGALTMDSVRSGRNRRDAMSTQDMNALLAPRNMAAPIGNRSGRDTTPDLGSPLMARLRDDAGVDIAVGRIDPFAGYANLLVDPTFDTLGASPIGAGTTIGTGYTAISPEWQAKYVLNSGTVATTRGASRLATRTDAAFAYGSSAVLEMTFIFGVNASDMTIYLRPTTAYSASGSTVPSWLTAGIRISLLDLGGGSTPNIPATAYLEIVDSADTVLASGDPDDLMNLLDLAEQARLEVGYEGPAVSTGYRFRLRIDLVKSAGATGQTYIDVSEPLLAFSDDGSAPAYTPAVGSWKPGSPGLQLASRMFLQNNVAAGATSTLDLGAVGFANRVGEVWDGSVVGMAYRWNAAVTNGSFTIRVQKNGATVWTAFSGATAQGDQISQPPDLDTFTIGDTLTVDVITTAGFLPTGTNDLIVELFVLLDFTAT